MKELSATLRMGLFHAAAVTFAAVQRLRPPAPGELAAAGLLAAALAPSYEEFRQHMVAQGRPTPDPNEFAEMLAAAQSFAVTVASAGEVQH